MSLKLKEMLDRAGSKVERRLFLEYGAVFVTAAAPPPAIIFSDSREVEAFQSSLETHRAVLGRYDIELQSAAMGDLLRAAEEIAAQGGSITPRAADSSRRSYQDTVSLWLRNVTRGLEKWSSEGRISADRAQAIFALPPVEQVEVILSLEEEEHLYFGTFFDRSILYSVAAPGASQHLSLLAFDVAEYQDSAAEGALNRHGWFRTVTNDLPHFTYLGHKEADLPGLGLKKTSRQYQDQAYSFWVPDLERLGAG